MRTLIAAVIGGLVVFACGYVSHGVLMLAESTFKPVKNEESMQNVLKDMIKEPGFYTVPYCSAEDHKDKAKEEAFKTKYKAGNAIIVRGRDLEDPVGTDQLMYQAAACVAGAFILALFLGAGTSAAGAVTRIFSGAAFGAFAWVSASAPNWIWYRFPWEYEQWNLISSVVEWAAAAFVMALILKKKAAPPKKA